MIALELTRIILLLAMLGIAAIFDIKTRKAPDHIWIVFGGFGALLYLFDWQNTTSYDILAIITTAAIAILLWSYRMLGQADIFALASMASILPVYYDVVMMPIVITLGAVMIAGLFTTLYNAILNLQDWLNLKQRPFSDFDEPIYKKILAFYTVHRQRRNEKFVILVEKRNDDYNPSCKNIAKKLELSGWKKKQDLTKNNMTDNVGVYVEKPPPLIVYMFGVAVFFLLPEILFVLLV